MRERHIPPDSFPGPRILFTPGPLTTTRTVKEAMLADIGSRDYECIELIREIREGLLQLVGGRDDLAVTPFQGSGTFAVEAALGSSLPRDGKLLVLENGTYGHRMSVMAEVLDIPFRTHVDPENSPHDPRVVGGILDRDPSITHVACVHCETTSGLLNPVREIGVEVGRRGRRFIVDAISSFGAYSVGPGRLLDFDAGPIDHLVGSANKCVEGVPGFGFVISRKEAVQGAAGNARSLTLDLHGQWSHLEETGQFRFTPPTNVLLAFRQALRELEAEGGVEARAARYRENQRILSEGMRELGFRPLLEGDIQSHIVTSFRYPCEDFDFRSFYDRLRGRGHVIYPGKLGDVDTFRIGSIGSIGPPEVRALLHAVKEIVDEGI